jgi:serine/threonine protein kinase
MQVTTNIFEIKTNAMDQSLDQATMDCKDILIHFGQSWEEVGIYLQVGGLTPTIGWVLHISCIRLQFTPLLMAILPDLIEMKIPFQIAKDKATVKHILDGSYGRTALGKVICVYPANDEEALILAKKLISLTSEYRCPPVATDCLLGGTVYTMYGSPITTQFNIPFKPPIGVNWPFKEILASPETPIRQLWNLKYRPLHVIKPDLKGNVIQGNYFKSILNIKLCVIKEGIKNMWADEWGRDIVDRLLWQYELYKDLAGSVRVPEIFDCFVQDSNTYLAMEFIKGESLDQRIYSIYEGNSWLKLSADRKIELVDILLKVIVEIEKLHERGYVHRDITPANFIITKRKEIYLIDLELSYSVLHSKPSPAFKLGTPGYMSPEQFECKTPDFKEDIYGLGALMILILSGLPAIKFQTSTAKAVFTDLQSLIENPKLILLIINCIAEDPLRRPSLSHIKEELKKYKEEIDIPYLSRTTTPKRPIVDNDKIRDVIEKGINGLGCNQVLTPDKVWKSRVQIEDLIGMQSNESIPHPGFYKGIAGISYLVATAKISGFNVDSCLLPYYASWQYMQAKYLNFTNTQNFGLYSGSAGIALAIKEGISAGLLSNSIYLPFLEGAFEFQENSIDLANGVAGQSISLLNCASNLGKSFCQPLLNRNVEFLLSRQLNDGSWNNYDYQMQKKDSPIGFAHGTAGILCFLIVYSHYEKQDKILNAIKNGMRWLIKKADAKAGLYHWKISSKSKTMDEWNTNVGSPGVALTFIKAYELLKDSTYKIVAEKALKSLPEEPVYIDYAQSNGLAGLGEIYLEAARIFKSEEWQKRANWIAMLFANTFLIENEKLGYWSMSIFPDIEPDLMTGMSGILHFLIRMQTNKENGHIILSNK